MGLNLIIKGRKNWRPLQPVLGHWKSLHKKDDRIVDASLSVKEMFSAKERMKIDAACIKTNAMGIDFGVEDREMIEESEKALGAMIVKPSFKSII